MCDKRLNRLEDEFLPLFQFTLRELPIDVLQVYDETCRASSLAARRHIGPRYSGFGRNTAASGNSDKLWIDRPNIGFARPKAHPAVPG
jgi:hypothetical protein